MGRNGDSYIDTIPFYDLVDRLSANAIAMNASILCDRTEYVARADAGSR
jgi:hypothetical protein